MSGLPDPGFPSALALVYNVASFERAISRPHVVDAYQQPDISLVVVHLAEGWKALDADLVALRVREGGDLDSAEIDKILGWFRQEAGAATLDFGGSRITLAGTTAQSVMFVPSGIQVPGIDPVPISIIMETYTCDGDEPHTVTRPQGSTDATCGEPCADGTPCTGKLRVS